MTIVVVALKGSTLRLMQQQLMLLQLVQLVELFDLSAERARMVIAVDRVVAGRG